VRLDVAFGDQRAAGDRRWTSGSTGDQRKDGVAAVAVGAGPAAVMLC
jgi:hypothetical protein